MLKRYRWYEPGIIHPLNVVFTPVQTYLSLVHLGQQIFIHMPVILFRLIIGFLTISILNIPSQLCAQLTADSILEKMPEDLEKDFALSALPSQLQPNATVYLLDPLKGYYISRQGTNGFVCFISRTEWEWGEFRKDLAIPMSYDAEGAKTVFVVYQDVAALRAAGKLSELQVRDTIRQRIKTGYYKAPGKTGISYMLAPVMRAYESDPGNKKIITISVPHYMFYAPYVTAAELGITANSQQNFILANPGDYLLGAGKGPYGIIIVPADHELKMKIVSDGAELLKRLKAYKPYFAIMDGNGKHHAA